MISDNEAKFWYWKHVTFNFCFPHTHSTHDPRETVCLHRKKNFYYTLYLWEKHFRVANLTTNDGARTLFLMDRQPSKKQTNKQTNKTTIYYAPGGGGHSHWMVIFKSSFFSRRNFCSSSSSAPEPRVGGGSHRHRPTYKRY